MATKVAGEAKQMNCERSRKQGGGAKTRPPQLLVIPLSHFSEKGSMIEISIEGGTFTLSINSISQLSFCDVYVFYTNFSFEW